MDSAGRRCEAPSGASQLVVAASAVQHRPWPTCCRGPAIIACLKRLWVAYVADQVAPLVPALVAHAEQQLAAKATANFVDHDALTVTQALYMDEGQTPGLSTEALSRELQRSHFKLSTREKMSAAAVSMASVTEQRTYQEALLSGTNDGHLRLRCVVEHCKQMMRHPCR